MRTIGTMSDTILVTGGAGYIGSHTCIELLAAGHRIVILDNLRNSKPEALRRIERISWRWQGNNPDGYPT